MIKFEKQNYEKNIKNKKIYMKTRRIEVIEPIIEDETANQINVAWKLKDGGPVIFETDLENEKTSLRSINVQKIYFSKNYLKS